VEELLFSVIEWVSYVRQIGIHTDEPLAPDPSPFEVEIATAMLKMCPFLTQENLAQGTQRERRIKSSIKEVRAYISQIIRHGETAC
jgi:hypothetical protein